MELGFRREAERMTRLRVIRCVSAILAVLLVLAAMVGAQVLTGTITGSVVDPSGAVIPNAKVTALDVGTNKTYTATTDSAGNFTITNVSNGQFDVTVEAPGFAKFIAQQVTVNVAQITKILVKMQLASAGTEVIVKADQEVVQTETAELKYAVERNQLLNLQLPTRNPMDLVKTLPGMATPTGGVTGGDVIVHGLRANSTNLTLDGINIADNFLKTSSFFGIASPVVDTIGEFNVSVGGVGADAGFGAAQVSMRTQRGTNSYHGALYWFERNSFLNANTFFNKQATPVNPREFQLQNRVGASIGGPVTIPGIYKGKNKTFFFFSFEIYRQPSQKSYSRTVLTGTARNGLFTYTSPTANSTSCPTPGACDGASHTVNLLQDIVPNAPYSILPKNANVMGPYGQLVSLPNSLTACGDGVNTGCVVWNVSAVAKQNRYAGRLDHNLTENHSLEFSWNQQNYFSAPDLLNNAVPYFPTSTGTGGGQESKRQVFSGALHSSFGGTKTNEIRAGVQRAPVVFTLAETYGDTNNTQLLLPIGANMYYAQTSRPQGRNTPVIQAGDNFAWLKSHHTLRFGGEFRQISANSYWYAYTPLRVSIGPGAQGTGFGNKVCSTTVTSGCFPGGLSSADLTVANNLYSMLTGLLNQLQVGYTHTSLNSGYVYNAPANRDPIQSNIAVYAQDSFKLLPNLSFEYGTRWEYQGVYKQRNGLVLVPQDGVAGVWGPAGVGNLFNPLTTPAMTDVTTTLASGSKGKPLYNSDWNNFAPFFGFAYDPWKDGKTVIRGAAAVHYTQDGFTVFDNAATWADGMTTTSTNSAPTGVYNPATIQVPAKPQESRSQVYNWQTNMGSSGLVGVSPDLVTPYVIEWNFALQREIGKRVTFEARYVGNHALKNFRMVDIDQINLYNNPYTYNGVSVANAFTEFMNARANRAVCGTTTMLCASGTAPMPILTALFNGVNSKYTWTSSSLLNYLRDGAVGSFFNYLRTYPYYSTDDAVKGYKNNLFTQFPLNFFVPNPWVQNAIIMNNGSWSRYDALELEVRRRFATGLFFQANYTFSKGLTDQRFSTSQSEYQAYRDISNPKLDKFLSPLNQQHVVSANFIYPLPFGKGQKFGGNVHPAIDKIIGGWQIQGMTRWATGSPFTISGGRWTTGANVTETAVLRNMSMKDLAQNIGTYKTPDKGVFWLNPASGLVTFQGSKTVPTLCTTGQTTPCFAYPGPGEMGNTSFYQWTGPMFWNQDFSFLKRFPVASISEQFNVEFRLEMYNAFNHPTFANASTASLTEPSQFGKLNSLVDTSRGGGVNARNMAFQLRVNF